MIGGEYEARARLKAYSRRWRVARDNELAYAWLTAHVRWMRVLERRAPKLTPVGNLNDLLNEGHC